MKKILLVLVLLGLAAGAWFWLRPHAAAAAPEADKPTAQVQVAPLQIQPISELVPAFGLIEPSPAGARILTVAYDAVVRRVLVSPGTRVAPGELLLQIEPSPDARLAVESARSVARLADRALAQTRQRLELKLATSQDLLAAQQAEEDAKLKLASIEARGQSGDGRVTAPEGGVVIKLDASPGTLVPAGTALATLAVSGHLEAHLAIEGGEADRVRAGQAVTIGPANRPEAALVTAKVRLVGASADSASGTVDVRVVLPPGADWFAGERVQASIEVSRKVALVAPRAAVLPDDEGQLLYIVKEGKAVKHAVQLGIASDDAVEVLAKDLHAGDSAVVVGNYELEDGMAVRVTKKAVKEEEVDDAQSEDAPAQDAKTAGAPLRPTPVQPEKKP
jgi:RND family efflux transporter MFP subunit